MSSVYSSIIREGPYNLVLSDMAPPTTGVHISDSARSAELFNEAISLAVEVLNVEGCFLGKIFQGSDYHESIRKAKLFFESVRSVKPAASRSESAEMFILCQKKKAA